MRSWTFTLLLLLVGVCQVSGQGTPPPVFISSSSTTLFEGQPITFTATVPFASSGVSVTFLDGGVPIGGGTTDQSGTVSLTTTLTAGTHSISAIAGSGSNSPSGVLSILVIALPASSVVITSTPASPTVGQPVTLIATIITANSQNNVSGTVQFFDGSKSLGTATVASNQAQITVTLTPGSHAITANYSGDSTYPPAAATNSISVHLLTTSLALTANTSSTSAGQPVTFTATVSATPPSGVASPTGQVQFFSGCLCGIFGALLDKTLIGIANVVNGVATLTTNALPGGSTQVLATYTGDANWGASTSNALNQTIAQTAAKISWISTSADANQIRLSAGLTIPPGAPAPTGSLQFVDRKTSAVLGSTSFSGTTATLTLPARPDLTGDPIVAIFSGDTNYSSSTSDPVELIALSDIASASPSSAAPDEILSIYGASLGNSPTPANDTTAPPTIVAGTQVQFTDSSGATHAAGLLFVSPNQINLVIPSDAVPGPGTLTVTNGAGTTFSRALTISTTAPTLFTTTGLSGGPAVAQIVRVNADGSQTVLSAASPIDLTSGAVYLVLYGTGIRHRTDTVSCAINGSRLPVAYAGPQSQTAGLDQVNVLLPASLKGAGQAQVSIAIGSQTSNPATLTFQ